MNIPLAHVNPPLSIRKSERNDPSDPRMGDRISSSILNYRKSDYVLLGSPQDVGVRRNKGRPGAYAAPDRIRRELYMLPAPQSEKGFSIFDLGDIRYRDTLEKTHNAQHHVVCQLLEDEKHVIILGGGNDISYPDASALHKLAPEYLAFNVDSHLDVRDNELRNSGTPYRQLLEKGYLNPHNFYEVGVKPIVNADRYLEYITEKKANLITLSRIREEGIAKIITDILKKNHADSIFWGIDMDSVRSADAPGVSAPYPEGLSSEEICEIGRIAGSDPRSRILEISEVNPSFDMDNRTSRLAALVIMYFIEAMIRRNSV